MSRAATTLAGLIIDLQLIIAGLTALTANRPLTPGDGAALRRYTAGLTRVLTALRALLRALEALELAILVARQALGAVGLSAPNTRLRGRIREWRAAVGPCPDPEAA